MRIRTTRAKGATRRKLTPKRKHVSHAGFKLLMRRSNRSACAYINRLDKQES